MTTLEDRLEDLLSRYGALLNDAALVVAMRHPAELAAALEGLGLSAEGGECRRCGKPIVEASGSWVHAASGIRGCRAASFTPDDGWDDDLSSGWKAAPRK